MITYLVGGAVRDELLNYPFQDRDWVVVGASEKALLELGYQRVGKDFPVFLHPKSKEEYALARLERKSAPGYKGFEVDTNTGVTLEQDLSRRDITINAMARDKEGKLIDPFDGLADLKHKIIRHVSPAFIEDPVRVLRVARFAARYHHLGFTVADETLALMKQIVTDGEVDHLVAERLWQEMVNALSEKNPEIFFTVLREIGALTILLPEIDRLWGVPNPAKWHPEIDTGIHTMMVLEQASLLSKLPLVRFAALCHDLGKGVTPKEYWPKHRGHEKAGVTIIKQLCERIRAPKEFKELACLGSEYHLHAHKAYELKAKTLLKLLEAFDVYRRPERFKYYLDICEADSKGRIGFENQPYEQRGFLIKVQQAVTSVSVQSLADKELTGKAIGEALTKARLQAIGVVKSQYNIQPQAG